MIPCFLTLLFIIYYIIYKAPLQPSYLPLGSVRSVREFIFEYGGVLPDSSSPKCSPEFYSKEELKPPHLDRPPQDPRAPGADGKPFVSHRMTAEEHKEKVEGLKKNQFNQFASNRISLHRDLGKDTRPPE